MVGDGAQARVRIRDRGHEVARLSGPAHFGFFERQVGPLPLVGLERERLGRGAGLGRDDEESRSGIQVVKRRGDRGRVRGVQDADRDAVLGCAEDVG